MTRALLFIGHGTRRQHGVDEFRRFVSAVEERVGVPVRAAHAFLELQDPDIVAGVTSLTAEGVRQIVCIPLFLFSAGHMLHDIPKQLEAAQNMYPSLQLTLSQAYGTEPLLLEALVQRIRETKICLTDESVGLLLLGRGNRDENAQAAFAGVAHQLAKVFGKEPFVGYLAGTGRQLEDTLTEMAQAGYQTVVLAPFLWFSGWLTDTLPRRVKDWQEQTGYTQINVRIAGHLGLHPAVVACVAKRIRGYLT
ncbi:hypothetical protein AAC03nite_17760 [Alicyclobacillus acidoterrestris]|uniref:sirohydrochlorin chelatase n=1 Tax=Alicyclobacillus suci TaxID=2816080 RepID=UPI0011925D01|nr:sirohydrochlorin chelatase [Alicyclobacillus suci]GEO25991.1 hypothetical protein AAC03nite_17760 [Alicyclobacillus acidoterrestris]